MSVDSSLISKIWNYAHVLRDDGIGYGDYLEQLTYLLFLKLAHEFAKPPFLKDYRVPEEYNWESLSTRRGADLDDHYRKALRELAKQPGILGQIFVKSQSKIQDPAKLHKIVTMIDKEAWSKLGADIKGRIYEGLLEKNAEDKKSGAGQYFTPRSLIRAMVACLAPQPKKTIIDPSCGTGGFFLAAYDYIVDKHALDRDQKHYLKDNTFFGNEIVASTRRLCLMNLFLHNIGDLDNADFISSADALASSGSQRFDYVLANPPFGKKSSITVSNEEGKLEKEELTYNRQDFFATTSNKQLNFLQHIRTLLNTTGQAAVVLPDNVLFEGGAGETVRKELLSSTDLHTILRLPTGIFYAQGVKANVLFFDNKPAAKDPWTSEVWIYDYRTNIHHTLKQKPMRLEDLNPFVELFKSRKRHEREETWSAETPEGRWCKFNYTEIIARDKTNLDIFWLKDDSLADLENLPEPDVLAGEIVDLLEVALLGFREVLGELESEGVKA